MTAMDSEQIAGLKDEQQDEQAVETEAEETAVEEKKEPAKAPARSPKHSLAELSEKQVKDLRKWELRELAEAEGIETVGTKTALVKRLIGKKRGGHLVWVNGHTLCKYCGAVLEAKCTRQEGNFIVRDVRCTSRHLHRYRHHSRVPEEEKG